MTNEYARTCKEVFEVLRLTPKAELKLIPIEVLNKLKMDSKNYKGKYKLEFDKMGEPKISHEAQVMILGIYRKYFLQENEKNTLNKKLKKNDNTKEIKKVENYNNPNDIFYKPTNQTFENIDSQENYLKDSLRKDNVNNNKNTENKSLIVSENKIILFIKNVFEKIKNIFK